MLTATTPTETPATAANGPGGLRPFRITVELYERMVASGVFGDKSKAFLWKGQLVEKVADLRKGRPHVTAVGLLWQKLFGLVPEGYFLEPGQPLALGDHSEPEPDFKFVRGAIGDYASRTPTAHDCPLVIEVADSSLADDTGEMLRAYAAELVPVYWVVNIPGRRVDVHTQPSGPNRSPSYQECRSYGPGEVVPVVLDGREVGRIAVDDVLIPGAPR